MSIQLSRSGRLHQIYDFTYNDWADRNFCPFFWKMLIAIALLPITWLSYPIKARGVVGRVFASLLSWATLAALAVFVSLCLRDAEFAWALGTVVAFLAALGVGCLVLIGIVFLLVEGIPDLKDAIQEKIRTNEAVNIVRAKKESVMDRYCPKIDWN